MANSRMVNIGISVDSQRAVKGLEKLRSEVDNLTEKLSGLQSKIKETKKIVDEDPNNKAAKSLLNEQQKQFEKTQKTLQKIAQDYQNMAQRVGGIDSMLQNISTANYNDLTWLRTTLTNSLKNRRIETAEELEAYRETAKRLQKVRDEILKRDIDMRGGMTAQRAKEVLVKPADFSESEINAAITTMTKLRDAQKMGSVEWQSWNKLMQDGKQYLTDFNSAMKRTEMENKQLRLPTISDEALSAQKRYWQEMIAGAEQGSAELTIYKQKLAEVNTEEEERLSKKAGRVMTDIEGGNLGGSIAQMQQRLKMLQEYRTTIDSTKPDAYLRVDAAIEKLNKGIKESQAGFMSFNDAMAKAANLDTFDGTLEDLEKIQKVIKEGMSQELNLSDSADIDRLKQATTLLDNITKKQQEMARINAQEKIDAVQANIPGSSAGEIEEAIRLAKDLQKANGTTGAEYIRLSKFIADAEAQLKSWNDEVKRATMEKQFTRLTSLSKSALEEQSKYWQEVFNNAEKGTAKYIQAEGKLKKIREEQLNRNSSEAGSIMNNLDNSSMQDIERAIKMTEQLRDAHSRGSHEYEIYSEEIKKAKEYLQSYVDMEKRIDMEDKWNNLTTLSANALAEQKKYWQEMIAGAEQGSVQLANYEDRLKEVIKEENNRLRNQYEQVLQDPSNYSVSEVQEAIKAFEKLRDAQASGSMQWKYYNQIVEEAKDAMKRFNDEAKESAMSDKLSSISSASTKSLAEQKKYWQDMVDGAEQGSAALTQYKDNLKLVTDEESRRSKFKAEDIMSKVEWGWWDGTIGETQEAIKALQEYRTLLKTTDAAGLQRVDEVLEKLKNNTKQAEQGFMSYQEALQHAEEVADGTFNGTIENLQQIQKVLLEQKQKKLTIGDKKGLDEVNKALYTVETQLRNVGGTGRNLKDILNDIGHASFNELQLAAKQLEEELKNSNEQMDDFAEKSQSLRDVNARMKELNNKWKEHDGTLMSTIKRLASYVAVYGGFNFVIGKLKEFAKQNLSLSDSMADVRKTTGMTATEISNLGKEIDAIDTRTTQQQLYELAATAGQLGIRGQENILGFVKASNMITVALNELGADGTASLMKIANLTGDITKYGTEDALLRIGSSINELTATTTATAGPISDFISRIGGIGSSVGLATHEMAAIGATADATGQSIEIAATSINKVLSAITQNTRGIAVAANVDFGELDKLVKSGNVMEALIVTLDAVSKSGGASGEVLKALGSEGARMNQYITSMVKNLDLLKTNLNTSSDAFKGMTSIIDEYNVKNENAAALWERIKNTLWEIVTNPRFVEWLTEMLQSLKQFVDWFIRSEGAIRLVVTALGTLIGVKVVGYFTAINKTLKEFQVMMIATGKWFITFGTQLKWATLRTIATTGAVNKLKVAFSGILKIIKAHPYMAVASAVAILARKFINLKESVDEVAKAQSEYNAETERENINIRALFTQLQKTNTGTKERIDLLNKINSEYGQYLGFQLQDLKNTEDYIHAQNLLLSIMKQQRAQKMENQITESIDTDYTQQVKESLTSLRSMLSGADNIGEHLANDAISLLTQTIQENLDKSTKEILEIINSKLFEQYGFKLLNPDKKDLVSNTLLADDIIDFINIKKEWQDAIDFATSYAKQELNTATSDVEAASRAMLNNLTEQYNELAKMDTTKMTEEEHQKHLKLMLQTAESYVKVANDMLSKVGDSEKKNLSTVITAYETAIEQLKAKLPPIPDPFGKGDNLDDWTTFAETIKNLDKASPKSLADTLKAIEEQSADMSESGLANFNRMFQTAFDTSNIENFNKQVKGLAKQIKDRLKELGRGTDANFLWGNGSSGENELKKKAREQYRAAIAALEAYFNERETLIRENGMKEGKTQVQINQELERLETEKLNDEIQLRKLLLEDYYKESTFDPSKYKGVISGTDYFKEKNMKYLAELREQLEKWGVAMEDGMKKQLTDRMVKLAEQALKLREKINKILLEDNFTEQVMKQYHDTLQELGLLFGLTESEISATSEKEGEQRLAYMREWSKNAYQMNEKHLYDLIEQNESFSKWRIGRTYEDYEALLIQLRKFNDDVEEAERKAAERRKKIFDKSDKGLELKEQSDKNIKKKEDNVDMWERFQGLDLSSEEAVHKAQIGMYKEKIDASEAYIAQIKKEMRAERVKLAMTIEDLQRDIDVKKKAGKDTTAMEADLLAAQQQQQSLIRQERLITFEEEQKIEESRQGMLGHFIAIEETKLNEAKKYTDAILEFSEQMGEAAFGEVEDRKEAAKQLIKTLLTTLKDWIQIKTTELVMEKLFAQQSTAISGQQTIQELSMTGSKATADVIAGTASATAKEVGSKGWIGLAVGAAIGAALSALLGLAMGAINKSKSEVAAVSGAGGGKLATGMLTYAEGNYPVLGNDGQVYNAKYEGAGMKTGIYRGGAHFGIFSEKKPEAIIDGDTTQRLIMNHPDIWKAIVTLSKSGRLPSGYGMRTFATGNINELTRQAQNTETTVVADNQAQMAQMQATIERNNQVMAQLTTVLAGGIHAKMYMYGEDGEYKKIKKAEKFAKRTKMG